VTRAILIGILILLIARAFWRLMDGVIQAAGGTSRTPAKPTAVKLVRDPVCGTHIPTSAALTLASNGTTHYFCSEACRERFRMTP
jgi:YHS domain-containing protein